MEERPEDTSEKYINLSEKGGKQGFEPILLVGLNQCPVFLKPSEISLKTTSSIWGYSTSAPRVPCRSQG